MSGNILTDRLERLQNLPDDQFQAAINDIVQAADRHLGGGGAAPQGDDLTELVNAKAAELLALSQAELSDEDRDTLRRAGAELSDPEDYLKVVQKVAAGAKQKQKQAPLMKQYREELRRAQETGGDVLMLRSRYRRQGLDI